MDKKITDNKKVNRKIRYTEKVIKDSFLDLLKEKPMDKITVKEITEMADINRATFYAHYCDIAGLIHEIEAEMAQCVINAVEKLYQSEDSQEDVVNALFDGLLANKEMCVWFMDDKSTGYGRKLIQDYAREKCLPVWKQKKDITEEQAEYFFNYIYSGAFGFLKTWYEQGFAGDPCRMKDLFNRIVRSNLSFIYAG